MKFLQLFRAIPRHYQWLLAKDDASAFPATCDDTAHGVAAGKVDPQAGLATTLRKFFFSGNWKVESREMPRFQIQGEGRILETFIASMIGAIGKKKPNSRVGWSWDGDLQEGSARTLRVVDRVGSGHLVTTDVSVFQRDGDLFIGMGGKAWSKMRFLTRTVGTLIVVALFVLIMSWVVHQPGFRKSWVRDFAKKHASTGTVSHTSGHGQTQAFTEVEPLETFIEQGIRGPSGDTGLEFLHGLMIRDNNNYENYTKLLSDYVDEYQKRALNFSEDEFKHDVENLIKQGFRMERLANCGVFPVTQRFIWENRPYDSAADPPVFTASQPRGPAGFFTAAQFNSSKEQIIQVMEKAWGAYPGNFEVVNNQTQSKNIIPAIRNDPPQKLDQFGGPSVIPDRTGELMNSLNSRGASQGPDVTKGLSAEENKTYFEVRLSLASFESLDSRRAFESWRDNPQVQAELLAWIRLGHKTRLPSIKNFMTGLDHERVVANLLLLAVLNHDLDSLIARLPKELGGQFMNWLDRSTVPPWSTFKLLNADWLLFLSGPAKVPALIFGALIALTMLMPRAGLRWICSLLRWPSPQTFDQAIASQNTTIQGMVGTLLRSQFRITQDRIIEIRNRA